MKTNLLILLCLFFSLKSFTQVAYKAQRIDSVIESNFNAGPYKIAMDSIGILSQNGRQRQAYLFYNRENNALKAVQEEDLSAKLRTTFYFENDSLIGIDFKRLNDSSANFFYFIDSNLFVKETNKFKKVDANELILSAKSYQLLYTSKNRKED